MMRAAMSDCRVTYVGHATTVVELDGVRLLTDPVLRDRVAQLRRTTASARTDQPDAVLISHGHYDHLDRPSLHQLARKTTVLLPRGLGRVVKSLAFADVCEMADGD